MWRIIFCTWVQWWLDPVELTLWDETLTTNKQLELWCVQSFGPYSQRHSVVSDFLWSSLASNWGLYSELQTEHYTQGYKQKNFYLCFIDYLKPLTVWIIRNYGKLLKRLTILDSSLTYSFWSSCLLTLPFFFQSLLLPGLICQSRNSQLPLPFVFQLCPLFKIHSKSLEKDFGIR